MSRNQLDESNVERLARLQEFATALVAADDLAEVAAALLGPGTEVVGANGGSLMVVDGARLQMVNERNLGADVTAEWETFVIRPGVDPMSDSLTERVPVFLADRPSFTARYPDLVSTIEHTPHQGWAVLPLLRHGQPVGALGLVYDEPQTFDTAEQLVLTTIGDVAAQAVVRMLTAMEAQASLDSLSEALLGIELPELVGVRMAGYHRSATLTSDAGGDWFDAASIDDGRHLIAIGDVAHHGAAAVGEMGRARAVMLTHALEGSTPARIAERTSATLARVSATFTTSCIATYRLATRRLRWTTAGHPFPLLLHSSGEVEPLASTHGPPLGVEPGAEYGMGERTLAPGDVVLLYTDGLIERRGSDFDADLDRLVAAVAAERRSSDDLDGFVDRLVGRLHPSGVHEDDLAVLAVEVST